MPTGPLQASTTSPKDLCKPPNPSPMVLPTMEHQSDLTQSKSTLHFKKKRKKKQTISRFDRVKPKGHHLQGPGCSRPHIHLPHT